MDLNVMPMPEPDEEYSVRPQHETSVQILRREREERRKRMRSRDESIQSTTKKLKHDNPKLPPGWLDCPNIGHEIAFIVPSKVPLDDTFNDYIVPGKQYSIRKLLQSLRVKGIKPGLVIDLTNTTRYYSTSEFHREGVRYFKLRCQGRDAVPDNESVNTFVFEVAQFIFNQQQLKKHVIVHCTHGHNRTGYMIVHYLMRTQQARSVTEAIQRFAEARPPGIYKRDYIDALYDFYHESRPDLAVVCPPVPDWKRNCSEDDDEVGAVYNNKFGNGKGNETEVEMTNDDVIGDKIPEEQESLLRLFCLDMLKLPAAQTKGQISFPGSHPVSLDSDNLQLLKQRYYYVSWKADGTRYMLLLSPDGCYLIDRGFRFRRIQMRFPCKNLKDFHQFTLLDGEMIIDYDAVLKKKKRRFLIYDIMAVNRVSVIERTFSERWKMIEKEVVEPRNQERRLMVSQSKPCYRYDLEPFSVRKKEFWMLATVGKLLSMKLPHEVDGLIFQCWDDPYVARTHHGLLKWKYPEKNSVDFLFEVGENGIEYLYLHEQGKKRLMRSRVVFDEGEDRCSYSGKIIECSWGSKEDVWKCLRVRTDKTTPNEFRTYSKVMSSIRDNITEDILKNEIGEIIRLPIYADRDRAQIDNRGQKTGKSPATKT